MKIIDDTLKNCFRIPALSRDINYYYISKILSVLTRLPVFINIGANVSIIEDSLTRNLLYESENKIILDFSVLQSHQSYLKDRIGGVTIGTNISNWEKAVNSIKALNIPVNFEIYNVEEIENIFSKFKKIISEKDFFCIKIVHTEYDMLRALLEKINYFVNQYGSIFWLDIKCKIELKELSSILFMQYKFLNCVSSLGGLSHGLQTEYFSDFVNLSLKEADIIKLFSDIRIYKKLLKNFYNDMIPISINSFFIDPISSEGNLSYHRKGPGNRYELFNKNVFRSADQYLIIREIDAGEPIDYVDVHSHCVDNINVFLGCGENFSGLNFEFVMGEQAFNLTSPKTVFVPAGIPHKFRPLSGSGVYLNHLLIGDYRDSIISL